MRALRRIGFLKWIGFLNDLFFGRSYIAAPAEFQFLFCLMEIHCRTVTNAAASLAVVQRLISLLAAGRGGGALTSASRASGLRVRSSDCAAASCVAGPGPAVKVSIVF
jgi:hypothetical protein